MNTAQFPSPERRRRGFTLVEMLVVMGIIVILASLLLLSLARAKAQANRTKCLNHMRQLNLAATMYADESDGEYPARRLNSPPRETNAWPFKLKPYFADWRIITCPSDRFGVAGLLSSQVNPNRSFLMNAFNDYFKKNLSAADYAVYAKWKWPHGMRAANVPSPSATLIFGEKRVGSRHVHLDVEQGRRGNDFDEIDHKRHGRGSNFAFVDGSVRQLRENEELYPENLWATVDEYRAAPGPPVAQMSSGK